MCSGIYTYMFSYILYVSLEVTFFIVMVMIRSIILTKVVGVLPNVVGVHLCKKISAICGLDKLMISLFAILIDHPVSFLSI